MIIEFTSDNKVKTYTFTGPPDIARIIRENEGEMAFILQREDDVVSFFFYAGPLENPELLDNITRELGSTFLYGWARIYNGTGEELPPGWVTFATRSEEDVKKLTEIGRRLVEIRRGKHTVTII